TDWIVGTNMSADDVNRDGIDDLVTTMAMATGYDDPALGDGTGNHGGVGVVFGREAWPASFDMYQFSDAAIGQYDETVLDRNLEANNIAILEGDIGDDMGAFKSLGGAIDRNDGTIQIANIMGYTACEITPLPTMSGITAKVSPFEVRPSYDDIAPCVRVTSGDINGDGYREVFFGGASQYSPVGSGYSVLVRGGAYLQPLNTIQLPDYMATSSALDAVAFVGLPYTGAGQYSNFGDINADGIDELLAGSSYEDLGGFQESGGAHIIGGEELEPLPSLTKVVFDRTSDATQVDLSELPGAKTIHGDQDNARLTWAFGTASVNTQCTDVAALVTATRNYGDDQHGAVFVVNGVDYNNFGDETCVDDPAFQRITGPVNQEYGWQILGGDADVNGDGIKGDLIVAAPSAYNHAGALYVYLAEYQ
ncbi:hypothetical protein K1X76_12355, partial [bacterium]|nr:hypothetical protein [bacterium]